MEANEGKSLWVRGGTRFLAGASSLTLALSLMACGESNPLNPDPQPTPTPTPSKAIVSLTLDAISLDTVGVPGYIHAFVSNVRLTESGGVAATIDFIRLDVYSPANALLERTQVPSAALPGGAALAANGVRDFSGLALGFNSDIVTGRYIVISVATTDARGNVLLTESGHLIFA